MRNRGTTTARRPSRKTCSITRGKLRLASNTPWGYNGGMKKNIRQRVLRRLKIVEGQIRGLERMVAQEEYCIDIIRQSLAAKEALSGVENMLLENHLATHVVEQVRSGQTHKAIREILAIHTLSKRK